MFFCLFYLVQSLSHVRLCNSMNCSTPGLPVHHQLPEFTQTHVHRVGDAIQPSHPLSSPSPPALNLSQHQGLFRWVSSSHEVAKVLAFQLQHQSFRWILQNPACMNGEQETPSQVREGAGIPQGSSLDVKSQGRHWPGSLSLPIGLSSTHPLLASLDRL